MSRPTGGPLTRENLLHAARMLRYGRNPAGTVYDSIGTDFFLVLDRGWLNLGLWDGDGSDPGEAPAAVRRLVREVAAPLPAAGDILDVGNGLGAQDPLIVESRGARSLTALNVTLSQLRAGREHLAAAPASPVCGDACRMPLRAASFDGLISVEAAFHFPSRRRFFEEALRVLRPGGVLTTSDIATVRMPGGPREGLAALSQLRVWGLRREAAATAAEIAALGEGAGFADVHIRSVGERVIGPALRFVRGRLGSAPTSAQALGARVMLSQVELLWERRMLDYVLLTARRP